MIHFLDYEATLCCSLRKVRLPSHVAVSNFQLLTLSARRICRFQLDQIMTAFLIAQVLKRSESRNCANELAHCVICLHLLVSLCDVSIISSHML